MVSIGQASLYEDMIDHPSYTQMKQFGQVVKLDPNQNSGLNGIRTHYLCDTGALLTELSSHLAAGHIVSS